MSFKIEGKVALISGGASGLGLSFAKELLRNGLKGVTLADINNDLAKQALNEIEKEFGPNKAIYVHTDVTNKQSYEEAFKRTIAEFKNLDILINNAGILNDKIWEQEIEINVKGVIHGVLLGLEDYIPKYRTSDEGVIVNMSSTAGVGAYPTIPIYGATKFAVLGLTKSFGDVAHYNRTKIRVLTLCPGATQTPLLAGMPGRNLGPPYQKLLDEFLDNTPAQEPEFVAESLVKLIKSAKSGTAWIIEDSQEPYEFILPPRESLAPKK